MQDLPFVRRHVALFVGRAYARSTEFDSIIEMDVACLVAVEDLLLLEGLTTLHVYLSCLHSCIITCPFDEGYAASNFTEIGVYSQSVATEAIVCAGLETKDTMVFRLGEGGGARAVMRRSSIFINLDLCAKSQNQAYTFTDKDVTTSCSFLIIVVMFYFRISLAIRCFLNTVDTVYINKESRCRLTQLFRFSIIEVILKLYKIVTLMQV